MSIIIMIDCMHISIYVFNRYFLPMPLIRYSYNANSFISTL